jgi:hypothetical protein
VEPRLVRWAEPLGSMWFHGLKEPPRFHYEPSLILVLGSMSNLDFWFDFWFHFPGSICNLDFWFDLWFHFLGSICNLDFWFDLWFHFPGSIWNLDFRFQLRFFRLVPLIEPKFKFYMEPGVVLPGGQRKNRRRFYMARFFFVCTISRCTISRN